MNSHLSSYARQNISDQDIRNVVRVLKSDYLTSGPEVLKFEKMLADFCGSRYAVACSNGTAALHLSYSAAGLSSHDTVFTSPITFLATANAARFLDADVEFVDVCKINPMMSSNALEVKLKACKSKNRVVVPVHFAGDVANMQAIQKVAKKYNCTVIEDASHALGASYLNRGKKSQVGNCAHSLMTTFSFHAIKNISMGEGGAITTNDASVYEKLLRLRNHGLVPACDADKPWVYTMSELGWNYRITDMQCALGLGQLKRIRKMIVWKLRLAKHYQELIAKKFDGGVRPLILNLTSSHALHLYAVLIDFNKYGITRGEVMNVLKKKGIGSQVHYIPLYKQPYYSEPSTNYPQAEAYYSKTLSLPIHTHMQKKDVRHVVETLKQILR